MDWLSRIFDWLREQEAGFSAVAAILVIAGVVFAGVRWLVQRGMKPTTELAVRSDVEAGGEGVAHGMEGALPCAEHHRTTSARR